MRVFINDIVIIARYIIRRVLTECEVVKVESKFLSLSAISTSSLSLIFFAIIVTSSSESTCWSQNKNDNKSERNLKHRNCLRLILTII